MTTLGAARIVVVLFLVFAAACGGSNDRGGNDDGSPVRERDIRFETSDDLTLTGRIFGSGRVGITLAHMFPSDARSWYEPARKLARAGYVALAFNFRGYASSEGEKSPSRAPADLKAAAAELSRRGARDVTFVGASLGGIASIVTAAEVDALAVVAISAPARFMGLDAVAVATSVQRPVLLMSSRGDAEAFTSLDILERALPNPDTKIYDGDAHGTGLLADRPEAIDEIVSFLKRYAPLSRSVVTPES